MDILKATIKVASAEDKGKTVKIFTDDKKVWFNLWKTKPDGSPSPSFLTFQQLGFAPTVEIEYVEKEKSFTGKEGNPVNYTERTIYTIKPAIGQTPTPVENSRPGASQSATAPIPAALTGRNFDQEAYEKCCSIWSAALLDKTGGNKVIETINEGHFWELFQAIKADGEKRFNPAPAPAPNPSKPWESEWPPKPAEVVAAAEEEWDPGSIPF